MPYAVAFLAAGESRSTVIDAADAATAVAAVMATYGSARFELLSVQPMETSSATGNSTQEDAPPAVPNDS